jgi:hypothetical protein
LKDCVQRKLIVEVADACCHGDDDVSRPLDRPEEFDRFSVHDGDQDVLHVRVRVQQTPVVRT